jgi:hypothetical protein
MTEDYWFRLAPFGFRQSDTDYYLVGLRGSRCAISHPRGVEIDTRILSTPRNDNFGHLESDGAATLDSHRFDLDWSFV